MTRPRGTSPSATEGTQISRRSVIISTITALTATSAGVLVPSQPVFGQEEAQDSSAGDRPTSEDAEILMWGESPDESGQQDGDPLYVPKTLYLHGDWHDVRLVSAIAWGDGREGSEVWTTHPRLFPGKTYGLKLRGIHPHPHWPHHYYLRIYLEEGTSESDKLGAVFRYKKRRGKEGVFTATFWFPGESHNKDRRF